MNSRRIVFNIKPTGWLGWLLLGLLAIPLIVLSFFFVAAAFALAAVLFVLALARIAWTRPKSTGASNRHASPRPDVIDVDSIEVTESARGVALDAPSPESPASDSTGR